MKFLLLLVLAVTCANGRIWGFDMHRMGARIAESYLTAETANAVDDVLNGQTLEEVSTWADSDARDDYPWSAELHYINTDDNVCVVDSTQLRKYCENDVCITGAIANYTEQLIDGDGNSRQLEEALKFLVHFVGDVHQPLHAGHSSDLGGNTIDVRFYGSTWNLHSLWDTGIPAERESELGSETNLENEIRLKMNTTWAGEINEWRGCAIGCEVEIASESAYECCEIVYTVEDGDTISDAYYNASIDIFEKRVAQYGIRLAEILNQVYDSEYRSSKQNVLNILN